MTPAVYLKEPDENNYLRIVGFRFFIHTLPKVSYFVQSANIPALNLGTAVQPTPFIDLPHPGDKMTHGELTIRFMIQEDMSNYKELYNWLVGLGFPKTRKQFTDYTQSRGYLYANNLRPLSEYPQLSDSTLMVLGSNNTPVARFDYFECYPTSLSGLEFDVSSGGSEYFHAEATFQYNMFIPTPLT
jgi:hypothetical protein